jgi:hypothetical protein
MLLYQNSERPQQHMKYNISVEMVLRKVENGKKIPFAGKHMNPFGTLQVHCCSSFEISEKATHSCLLIMFPVEKTEALKGTDKHGSKQD